MASPHTAERVFEVIEVLAEWEISYSKVPTILTDNGSNMVAAFRAHFQKVKMKRRMKVRRLRIKVRRLRMKVNRFRIKVEILRMKVMLILVLMNVLILKGERWTMNLF